MVGTVIIVSPCINNVLLLVPPILFLYLILFSSRTNELIGVKEVPVTGKVYELGQTDGTSIGDALVTRRLRNRELCSPRGFGGMEYHAWLPERRPLLLGELGLICSFFMPRFLLAPRLYPIFPRIPFSLILSCQSAFSFLYIFSSGFCFRLFRFLPLLPTRLESFFFRISREKCCLTHYCPYPERRGKNIAESNRLRA